MEVDGPAPSVVSYGSACAAVAKGGLWEEAMEILAATEEKQVPGLWDSRIYENIIFKYLNYELLQ